MNHEFKSSTAARFVFAAAAFVITASIGGLIDHLATAYTTPSHVNVASAASQMAAISART